MPDLFRGDPVPLNRPEGFDLMEWLSKGGPDGKGHGPHTVDPIVEKVIKEMKDNLGVKKIGSVGYCFGVSSNQQILSLIQSADSHSLIFIGQIRRTLLS